MDETFFPELLQTAGYDTALFGKWHLGFFKPEYAPCKCCVIAYVSMQLLPWRGLD